MCMFESGLRFIGLSKEHMSYCKGSMVGWLDGCTCAAVQYSKPVAHNLCCSTLNGNGNGNGWMCITLLYHDFITIISQSYHDICRGDVACFADAM